MQSRSKIPFSRPWLFHDLSLESPYFTEHGFFANFRLQKSCYDIGHICPIRTEISTHKHWENVFILYFVWLLVIGFWQNYFHTLPNFGDFGAKMSFLRYIINQKRKIFIKNCSPRCSNTPLISEMCIYITHNLCKWGLGTPGGTMFYRQKMGEGQLTAHEIPL